MSLLENELLDFGIDVDRRARMAERLCHWSLFTLDGELRLSLCFYLFIFLSCCLLLFLSCSPPHLPPAEVPVLQDEGILEK